MNRGLFQHFLLTLRLNFRSRQAIVYGYLVPVFFLVAFASVFRADSPALLARMGQVLTIGILGGACFGLPTALVAERERGVWRRYRLLPVPTGSLVLGSLAARLVIVASSAVLQIAVARYAYHTPFPAHPLPTLFAFLAVCLSFLGLGLLVASIADDVPAVQALGQCLFLPMILIGGVAVPLSILPPWARLVSGFMPGRYAVAVLQAGYVGTAGGPGGAFDFLALALIGAAAGAVGMKLFRWETGRLLDRTARIWVGVALLSWAAVGLAAGLSGRLAPPPAPPEFQAIGERQIAGITYGDLPGDNELATPIAPRFTDGGKSAGMDAFAAKLKGWEPGHADDAGQAVRNLICVASIADLAEDPREGVIARTVFTHLEARYHGEELRKALAWVALYPNEGTVVTSASELGFPRAIGEEFIRDRNALYARKFLGKAMGRIRD
jgi:ABC-2 type transport system permease protein